MMPTALKSSNGQFRIAAIGENRCTLQSYHRRDFYKIGLVISGEPCQLRYGPIDSISIDRPVIIFLNPMVPCTWSVPELTIPNKGYFCVFDDGFITSDSRLRVLAGRIFTEQESPAYFLEQAELQFLTGLFADMHKDSETDYYEKEDLYRSHLSLIFHKAIQMRAPNISIDSGHSRIVTAFNGLLRRQFPVDMPLQPIKLKKASDYADKLAVHVNHLNMAVQSATGKSTTRHISELIFSEAKSLLSFTSYSIAEIAFCLGFEYQSYFNRFFKKYSGVTPSNFRKNFEKYK
ncbi:helix-turn-helix domain-containing protein [Pedobacter sp. 22163]|uniref:helix-turn-helix domain-containing protein n=1 Tax=Pedobacter sp. 22163 TaxID=3453883 RepID=UPI003F83DA42